MFKMYFKYIKYWTLGLGLCTI